MHQHVTALEDSGSEESGYVPQTGVTEDATSLAVIMILSAMLGVTMLLKRRAQLR